MSAFDSRARAPASLAHAPPPARTAVLRKAATSPPAALGNQRIQRLLQHEAVQPKLEVNPADDEYEREADAVARAVTSHAAAAPVSPSSAGVQRKPGDPAPTASRPILDDEKKRGAGVQRAPAAAPAPKKADDDGKRKVQRAIADTEKKRSDDAGNAKKVQREESSAGTPEVTPEIERRMAGSRGGGRPLSAEERGYFEPRMGADLGAVRIHSDAEAARAARDLSAEAFTHGQDVYFAEGKYQPHTDDGRRLMAHELTHTVQQAAAPAPAGHAPVKRHAAEGIQRAAGDAAPPTTQGAQPVPAGGQPTAATGTATDSTITFQQIELPSFKNEGTRAGLYNAHKPLMRTRHYQRGNPQQRNVWKDRIAKEPHIKPLLASLAGQALDPAHPVYKIPMGTQPLYFFGDRDGIASELTTPSWFVEGTHASYRTYDVDHVVELQLAGWPNSWANTLDNMELLRSDINQSSGRTIQRTIEGHAEAFLTANRANPVFATKTVSDIKDSHDLVFREPATGQTARADTHDYWTQEQIVRADHLRPVLEVTNQANLGAPGEVRIFRGTRGGFSKSLAWAQAATGATAPVQNEVNKFRPLTLLSKQFNVSDPTNTTDPMGTLQLYVPANSRKYKPLSAQALTIHRIPGAPFLGYFVAADLQRIFDSMEVKGASPIHVGEVDLRPEGLVAEGKLLPDVPFIGAADIDIRIAGDDLTISKTFERGELRVPPPFHIYDTSLTLFYSTERGLGAEGAVSFGVDRVGTGRVAATIDTRDGFALHGAFDFDPALVDQGHVALDYVHGELSGSGHLAFGRRIPGVRSGTIDVAYEHGTLTAQGAAQLSVPGVRQAALAVTISETEGMSISGDVQVGGIPGIQDGALHAQVARPTDRDGWSLGIHGTLSPAIPGLTSQVTADYQDGAFTVEGQASLDRGLLHGSVLIGATNRAIGPDGRPAGPPTATFRAYGGGSVTVRLTSWLQGTIGATINPDGSLTVSGGISLPQALTLFDRRDILPVTNILPIPTLHIPIFLGINATITGGLNASAGIGPATLDQLSLNITYNPEHEEQTHITGAAALHIPADATLALFVRGGLEASLLIASIEGFLQLDAGATVHGEAGASVLVDWTPQRGLAIDSSVFVSGGLDLFFTASVGYTARALWWSHTKTYPLASTHIPTDYRFGMQFPFHYREGQPISVSFSDITFTPPDIDATDVVTRVADRARSDRGDGGQDDP